MIFTRKMWIYSKNVTKNTKLETFFDLFACVREDKIKQDAHNGS